jgi:hypothetical protein
MIYLQEYTIFSYNGNKMKSRNLTPPGSFFKYVSVCQQDTARTFYLALPLISPISPQQMEKNPQRAR